MALPLIPNPETVPLNVMFPEQYAATKRMIVQDFAAYGILIVGGVLAMAYFFH